MKKHLSGLFCTLLIISVTIISWKPLEKAEPGNAARKPFKARELLEKYVNNIYESAHLEESGLNFLVFKRALTGFINLKATNKLPESSAILSVVDLSKSSREKRMWIIDVLTKELVLNTWTAHGHGSGGEIARRFSNKVDSRKSSLGFYITDDIYYGKNGRSLRLDGMDEGFNSNARKRAIVVHAADYVGPNVLDGDGRLGRSFGCLAVSTDVADMVLDSLKNKTVIYVHGNYKRYKSKYLNENTAARFMASDLNSIEFASVGEKQ